MSQFVETLRRLVHDHPNRGPNHPLDWLFDVCVPHPLPLRAGKAMCCSTTETNGWIRELVLVAQIGRDEKKRLYWYVPLSHGQELRLIIDTRVQHWTFYVINADPPTPSLEPRRTEL